MPVEFIGMIGTPSDGSEIRRRAGPGRSTSTTRARFARAHEDAGFDRVLIGYGSSQPDGMQVAAYARAPHRAPRLPGRPPARASSRRRVAARTFATLDQFTGGRIAVHIITGGNDAEQRRDGDHLPRTSATRAPTSTSTSSSRPGRSDAPFDYDGRYYRFEDACSEVRSRAAAAHPALLRRLLGRRRYRRRRQARRRATRSGASRWPRPPSRSPRVRAAAAAAGRDEPPRISVSFRPILGADRGAGLGARAPDPRGHAGERRGVARRIGKRFGLADGAAARTPARSGCSPRPSAASCTTARCGRRSPRRPAPPATRPRSSARPRPSPQALLDYVDIGVTTLLIRGYDPLRGRHRLRPAPDPAGAAGGRPPRLGAVA